MARCRPRSVYGRVGNGIPRMAGVRGVLVPVTEALLHPYAPTARRMENAMNTIQGRGRGLALPLFVAPLLVACTPESTVPEVAAQGVASRSVASARTIPVSGGAVHFFTTAVIHSEEPTQTGKVQRSTEIIRLTGDLDGYILYHPTSTFDLAGGTLVNTGTQVFSGTVAGSEPVILHDDRFRFEVDLATGATVGEVHLSRSRDAPDPGAWYECDLEVVGTGMTPAGDAMANYSGSCTGRGSGG
jgi:hypothetical protein